MLAEWPAWENRFQEILTREFGLPDTVRDEAWEACGAVPPTPMGEGSKTDMRPKRSRASTRGAAQ